MGQSLDTSWNVYEKGSKTSTETAMAMEMAMTGGMGTTASAILEETGPAKLYSQQWTPLLFLSSSNQKTNKRNKLIDSR